ncbi:MerR family transcriptional regulator [Kitasatospora sp. NE20-6]|uniref:helix-turn-helix domain-containing protein n=1 Tax=Kitasatospora sp. NE20-6 TaxID=2859066 RepID=UPI0034DBCE83
MDTTDRELYSVGEVAELLGLHVRTVRSYVREGRLKATRIGKQYRIAREDFEALTGRPAAPLAAPPAPASARGHVEVSSIVQIDGIDAGAAARLSTLLTAGAQSRQATPDPLRIQTIHDRERARMKIVILGPASATADLLHLLDGVLGPGNGMTGPSGREPEHG